MLPVGVSDAGDCAPGEAGAAVEGEGVRSFRVTSTGVGLPSVVDGVVPGAAVEVGVVAGTVLGDVDGFEALEGVPAGVMRGVTTCGPLDGGTSAGAFVTGVEGVFEGVETGLVVGAVVSG